MKQRGFAIIFILLIVSVLILYVLEFNFNSRVELALTEHRLDRLRSLEVSRSALNFVEAALISDPDRKMDNFEEDWAKVAYYGQLFGVVFPGAVVNIVVEDESGKLNVNKLIKKAEGKKKVVVDRWLAERIRTIGDNLFAESAFVDAVIDWIDPDDDDYYPPQGSDSGGAEDSFYQGLKEPYSSKDGLLDSLDELILIKGIDEQFYFGQGGAESPGLRDLLTVYSDGKININTASKQVIQSLHPMINESLAEKIVKQRQNDPFTTAKDFLDLLKENGVALKKKDKIYGFITIKSSGYFKVEITVRYQEVGCYLEAVLRRKDKNVEVVYSQVKY